MSKKTVGWLIIAVAIVAGALRLLNVIDNAVTAVLFMGGVIILGGASARTRKKQPEKSETREEG